jgi:dTMP kinase
MSANGAVARGKFITLEGIEAVGKSTNLEFVAGLLRARGLTVLTTREPGGTRIGEQLRDVLLNSEQGSVPDTVELLLMFAARAAHLQQVIWPALARGDWVVCDRFTDASYAYQGGGRGLDDTTIDALSEIVQGDFAPDLTVLLDASLDATEARRAARGSTDRFEAEQADFFNRVRSKYLQIAEREPARVIVVDASVTLEAVQRVLRSVVEQFLDN